MTRVTAIIIATFTLLVAVTVVVITLARGYQFDFSKKTLFPTGILVATSDPDGAEVFISGKLTTATNNTINLAPGKYPVKIVKDGFVSWEKEIEIKKEEVFKTNVFLFPSVPDLRPLTLTGALDPTFSPDFTKIVYGVASASAEKSGVWVIDLGRVFTPVPIISNPELRQIYKNGPGLSLSSAKFQWSPDSRQVIATGSGAPILLDADRGNDQLVFASLSGTLAAWDELKNTRSAAQKAKLSPVLANILVSSSANLSFSPDETKIFYQATASANLPAILLSYLPGTNPTAQTRDLKPGNFYVYDLKEDRNYLIENCKLVIVNCSWFPSSRHILAYTKSEIAVMEYDGTNKATVYAGPFIDGVVFPWPNWSKIVILTSLSNIAGAAENLYTINLR